MNEYAMTGTLTKREAKLLYRIDLRDSGMDDLATPLEMIAVQALGSIMQLPLSTTICVSYHSGGDFMTATYNQCQFVLVQTNEPLVGMYIGKKRDVEILKSGLEVRAAERRSMLLKRYRSKGIERFVRLEDVENLPRMISNLKIVDLTEDEVVGTVEDFYSERGSEFEEHRKIALRHLDIPYSGKSAILMTVKNSSN